MTAPRSRLLPRPLAGAAAIAIAMLLALAAGSALSRLPFAGDAAILAALRGAGPAWLRPVATTVTALGGGTALTIIVLAAAILLLIRRLPLTAAALVAGCWTGGRAVALIKGVVERARPDLADRLVPVSSASFPSSHAANSAIVYLTLAALVAQVVPDRANRRALFAGAILLSALIGISRIYLGVHWPSDVLAGWSFGALWALGWWWLTERARASIGGER